MLQAVVRDDQFRALLHREPRAGDAIRTDHHDVRAPTGMQQRLIAYIRSGVGRTNDARSTGVARAVSTEYHGDTMPAAAQLLDEPRRHRCLAGAPHRDVADDHDGHADVVPAQDSNAVERGPNGNGEAENRRQRPQRQAAPGGTVPEALQTRVERHRLSR